MRSTHADYQATRDHRVQHGLGALFSPSSIAVIGASERVGSVGRAVLENLAPFAGSVYPVNPNHKRILGKHVHAKIADIGAKIDLAVIATPAATVPLVIRDCVSCCVSAAVILSAGFKECGDAGRKLESDVLEEASRGGMRIIGPNCLGLMIPHRNLNASFARRIAMPGNLALLSQSGALCTAILDWSFRENVGFSGFVSVGSMIDVHWGDLIDYFAEDPHTKSILCYIESIGDARAFMSAAREASFMKPVIVLKAGRTSAAAAAAICHTGSLTGSDAVVDAALHRCGALRVNSLDELFDMAEVLSKQPLPAGPKLAIVTNAGGPGVLAADTVISCGAEVAKLSPATTGRLNGLLPAFWSHANPVDILGDADAARFSKSIECIATDPANDAVLAILTPQAMTDPKAVGQALRDSALRIRKPVLASWIGGASVAAGRAVLNSGSIPTFDTPESAARAFALAWKHTDEQRRLYEIPDFGIPVTTWRDAHSIAGPVIDAARHCGRTIMNAGEAAEIFRAYGIAVIESRIALSEHVAVHEAEKVGFPVAIKLHSETITHKSDVGGVILGVANADEVRQAWKTIEDNLARSGSGDFSGVTIQPMVRGSGIELIFGSVTDPQFGPTITFGAGGKWVEIMKDTAIALPPLTCKLARRLMENTKIFQALKGVRGEKRANIRLIESLLIRFGELVLRERGISEIEINPLLIAGDDAIAVDVRVVLHPKNITPAELPASAIRSYPIEYIFPCHLKNGASILLRPARAEDEPMMAEFHQSLSDRTVYSRYFAPLKVEQRIQHERLSRRCSVDYDREQVLVAEYPTPDGKPHIVAIGRLTRAHLSNEAEFALLVADEWQGRGLGFQILTRLVEIGRSEKLDRLTGLILEDNQAMRKLAEKVGFALKHAAGECVALLNL